MSGNQQTDDGWIKFEDKLVEVLSVHVLQVLLHDEGPLTGTVEELPNEPHTVVVEGDLNLPALTRDILATAVWVYDTAPEWLDYMRDKLHEFRETQVEYND